MKTNIKRRIIGALTAVTLIATLSSGCVIAKNDTSSDGIKVTYDGETIEFDVQPEIINDRVMVPMRAIFEAFGAKVKWDGDTQTITSKKKSKTITMTIGSTDMTKNEDTYTFDTAPVIEDGRTLVPIRAISEMLGLDVEWDEETETVTIVTPEDEDDDAWKENTGTIELSTMKVTGDGISVSDNVITITEGGDFTVTGESENGQIVIDTEEKVKLRLSGMSLTNPTGSAIYVKNADKAYITLTDGTDNTLTDGETYTSGDENEKGTITSRDNLEIKGKGSLTINANYKNGIDASDSLDIENGSITINAVNDGINVNDTLTISGGTLNVTAESDGLQAGDIVDITSGEVNITTTGDVPASTNNDFGFGRGMQQTTTTDDTSSDVTSKGIKADWFIDISGGTINLTTTDHAIHSASDIEISGGDITIASDNKGISAHEDLTINGGTIDITKSTEGIESKAIMTVNDGDISVVASDDGFNAGGGGDMFGGMGGGNMGGMNFGGQTDTQSESTDGTQQQNMGMRGGRGMRGQMQQAEQGEMPSDMQNGMTPPEMNGEMPLDMQQGGMGGRGRMMTPPDMQNGEMPSDMQQGGMMTPPDMQQSENSENSGTEQRGMGGFGGMMGGRGDSSEISTEHHIQINGGTIYINAMGDGIDSNGSIVIDGGTVTVDGTTNGGNSALDHDGTMMVNGGTLIAVSAIGMVEAPGSYSTQNVLNYTLSESVAAGTEITVKNSSGKTIASHKSANAYQSFIFSSDELVTGETYTIYVGGEEKDSFTVSDVITTVGTATSGGMGFGGGRGGMRGMQQNTDTTAQ